jgi:septum formation protein
MSNSSSAIDARLQSAQPPLILASASKARAQLLSATGIAFVQQPADIDEPSARAALEIEVDMTQPGDIAEILAIAKAAQISELRPDALVIGADQVLALNGRIFSKPGDFSAARDQLLDLSGKAHTLHTAVSLCREGHQVWSKVEAATLRMRNLSPEFIGRYLSLAGPEIYGCVGAYQLEGVGAQLFETVDGDYFTVLGLPLLPLLAKLRELEVLFG